MKILTVSVAAYNVEKYIDKALMSLCCDKDVMGKFEVIVEDDGSTDNTFNIAQKYEKMYPDVFIAVHKGNGGYGSTINNSLRIAKGKYFKQLDGDDWFDSDNFSLYLNWLEEQDADFIVSPYYNCYEDGSTELVDQCKDVSTSVSQITELNKCDNIAMHELTVRTDLFRDNDIRISENCFYSDNEYTFLPLLYAKTVIKYEYPIYCYRLGRDGQSVSVKGIKKHYQDSAIVAEKMYSSFMAEEEQVKTIMPIISSKLVHITDTVYTYYAIASLDDSYNKKKLREFDSLLKEKYKSVYVITNRVKKIKLLRFTGFMTFGYVTRKILKKYR